MDGGRVLATLCTVLVLGAPGLPAQAIDPSNVRYLDHPGELLWFVQISDSHVGEDWGYGTQDTDNLTWVVDEMVQAVLPEFVVLTGDIVDATNGYFVPTQQYQAEWDEYRGVVDGYGMDLTFFHDVCGNHDTYTDSGATHYLDNSLTGETTGEWHEAWVHSYSFGEYLFIGLNSADTDGSIPGLDSPGLDGWELMFLGDSLEDYEDAELAFVFTHHPHHSLGAGDDEVLDLLATHRVSAWGNGHDHDYRRERVDEALHVNIDSLGKADHNNLGLWSIDGNGLSVRGVDIGEWPVVLVTTPVDAELGGHNPHANPVSIHEVAHPVRALVFDTEAPQSVSFTVDGVDEQPMTEVLPSVWQGEWDCSGLTAGVHELEVYAVTPSGVDSHRVQVEVAVTECDDGQDNDGDGDIDFPDDEGCWGASDDSEEGEAGDDDTGDDDGGDDDTGDDDAGDDDTGDDDAGDDDDVGDDDTDDPDIEGGDCSCSVGEGPAPGALALLAIVSLSLARRLRRSSAAGRRPTRWAGSRSC